MLCLVVYLCTSVEVDDGVHRCRELTVYYLYTYDYDVDGGVVSGELRRGVGGVRVCYCSRGVLRQYGGKPGHHRPLALVKDRSSV